jgi:hypothetical protein
MLLLRRAFVALLGLFLLAAPLTFNLYELRHNERPYQAPEDPGITFQATPAPTATPALLTSTVAQQSDAPRLGAVVVDLAHFSFLNPTGLQPLADSLAERGLGLRLWFSKVDASKIEDFLDFPDQSVELAVQLADASALVVVSPFFLWSSQEISLVERFVADGGRLLLISDPDLFGDFAAITNFIAEPFGIVFNDDYLYDTTENDGNFTHFFQGEFRNQAAALNGARVAFYGGRSIGGAVVEQATSTSTTLSSLRTGATGFTTVAIGGVEGQDTANRVLALSDFDVLTEPYVARHNNRLLAEFVAGFLAGEQRINGVADFPNYLGKRVALTFGQAQIVDPQLLLLGAQLQKRLEASSRTLALTTPLVLTATHQLTVTAPLSPTVDVIYLADYATAAGATTLLADAGLVLSQAIITPTGLSTTSPQPVGEPAIEPTAQVTFTEAITLTAGLTTTEALTRALPVTVPVTTTLVQVVIQTSDGLQWLAEESVSVLQRPATAKRGQVLAVLGANPAAISAGVNRLLSQDFTDCITGEQLTLCPLPKQKQDKADEAKGEKGPAEKDKTASDSESSQRPGGGADEAFAILIVDDNQESNAGEESEADRFLRVLGEAGYTPDLWTTADQKTPTGDQLNRYQWVIWSNAGYADGAIAPDELEALSAFLGQGGRLTLSSLAPLFGTLAGDPSVIRDLVTEQGESPLLQGLPDETILLAAGLPPAVPLSAAEDGSPVQIVLRRGPQSDDAAAPALLALTDNHTGARFQIAGFSFTWLPAEVAQTLINNLAQWMTAETAE